MNFSDNLKRLRKEKNMSQEMLAEQLLVSRQSVSKWESGQAYPEMDKVLDLCKMFDVTIDELMNEKISEVKTTKESKKNINKFVEDFLNFITDIVNISRKMTFLSKVKCLAEQIILMFLLYFALFMIGKFGDELVTQIFGMFDDRIFNIIYHIIFSVYLIGCLVFVLTVTLHVFKIRYIDYYKDEPTNKPKEEKELTEEKKIIVRDPNDSGYGFINSIVKLVLFFIKCFVLFIGACFCLSLITFALIFALSLKLIGTNFFISVMFMIIPAIIINVLILLIIYNFISNRKSKGSTLFIIFISSLIVFGIGAGLFTYNISKLSIIGIQDDNSGYFVEDELDINMEDNLFIPLWGINKVDYIESNNDNLIVKVKHSKYSKIYLNRSESMDYKYILFSSNVRYGKYFNIDSLIEDLKNNVVVRPDEIIVTVYTNKDNIEKLNKNISDYYLDREYSIDIEN